MSVDILPTDDDISGYFSDIIPYDIEYDLDGSSFLTFGYRFQIYKYSFGLSFEESTKIRNNLDDFSYNYLVDTIIETIGKIIKRLYSRFFIM